MNRSVLHKTAAMIVTVGLTLLSTGLLVGPSAAQTAEEQVPCDVAMVVGCVSAVEESDGQAEEPDAGADATPQVSDSETEQPASTNGEAGGDKTAGAGGTETESTETGITETGPTATASNSVTVTDGTAEGAVQTVLVPPDTSDRPLTDLDPWEGGGLKSNFGSHSIPISHYQIGADVDGWLGVPDPLDSFVASQTNWAFTTATFLVILASNALDWAFEFPLAEDLIGDAGVLAQNFSINFFGFGLSTSIYSLALSVTMVVAGFKAVTKGMIAAGSEVLFAFIAYVVLIVLTLTSSFGEAGLTVARISSDLSSEIASFAAGQDRQQECATKLLGAEVSGQDVPLAGAQASTESIPAASSSACSFGFAIQRSLVELPYQNIQWGQVLDGVAGKERCAEINLELLADGPWGNDDKPRDRMRSAPECEENADFNHQATYIRLGIASANTISAAIVTLLLLIVSAMLLWQQAKLLFLTVLMPHALVMAILPGRSRKLAWQWVEHLVGVVIRTLILALGLVVWLSLFSLIVYEQLTLRGIFLSLFASMAMAISGFYGLYRLSKVTGRINPIATRNRNEDARDPAPENSSGGAGGAARTIAGARSTLRSVRRRSAPPLSDRSTISGGPGDLPGGGAAATSTGGSSSTSSSTRRPASSGSNRPTVRTRGPSVDQRPPATSGTKGGTATEATPDTRQRVAALPGRTGRE